MTNWLKIAFPAFLALTLLLTCCQKERFTTDPNDRLEFSTDTLHFDTVFTQLGSATRTLKIYNRHKESLRVSRIFLENGAASRFNLNVDGLPGREHRDIEIAPNDSLYIFAEVTINPDNPLSASPFIIDENLVFETNGNTQKVVLEAWGQNANYIPSRFYADSTVYYGCNGGEWVWDDPKPYVLYGQVGIGDCTVRIPAGARVYVHGGLTKEKVDSVTTAFRNDGLLFFYGNGRLIVEGTRDNPVIFEGDRLESEFDDEPGQWTGILLTDATKGHSIQHCIIRNSVIGVYVDSAAELSVKDTRIYNTTNGGLIGVHAKITAENCLFYNHGSFAVQLAYGGDYQFTYCTIASYGVDGESIYLGNARCLDQACQSFYAYPLKARFNNCIAFGSRADQISLFDRLGNDPASFDYRFEHCVVRVRDLIKPEGYPDFPDHCQPCLFAEQTDTLFVNPNRDDYHLDTIGSVANRYAVPVPGIDHDLDGKLRDAVAPDAGCFEIEF
ncbi:MAG: right-handed parallel beta-helix repeat-containing protein [Saprospiraceae bacterium]